MRTSWVIHNSPDYVELDRQGLREIKLEQRAGGVWWALMSPPMHNRATFVRGHYRRGKWIEHHWRFPAE